MLSVIILNVTVLNVIMLSGLLSNILGIKKTGAVFSEVVTFLSKIVNFGQVNVECNRAECCCSECYYAECH